MIVSELKENWNQVINMKILTTKKIGGREGLSCENYKKRNINGEQDKDDSKVKEIFNDTEKVKINGNHLDEVFRGR